MLQLSLRSCDTNRSGPSDSPATRAKSSPAPTLATSTSTTSKRAVASSASRAIPTTSTQSPLPTLPPPTCSSRAPTTRSSNLGPPLPLWRQTSRSPHRPHRRRHVRLTQRRWTILHFERQRPILPLWDLRMMHSSSKFERMTHLDYGLRNWDYRNMSYRQPRYQAHPQDCSVMTYRGHAVLKTLIRCHFSPRRRRGRGTFIAGVPMGRFISGTSTVRLRRCWIVRKFDRYTLRRILRIRFTRTRGQDRTMRASRRMTMPTSSANLDCVGSVSSAVAVVQRKHPIRHTSAGSFDNPLAQRGR